MTLNNFERLIKLADEVFAAKSDPSQLNVNQDVIERLLIIHPATVSEYRVEEGPAAWLLVIPTTLDLMNQFLAHDISEKELFDLTPLIQNMMYFTSARHWFWKNTAGKGLPGNWH